MVESRWRISALQRAVEIPKTFLKVVKLHWSGEIYQLFGPSEREKELLERLAGFRDEGLALVVTEANKRIM